MTQEEKLKEAKRLYKTANADQKYVLERLFPELAEPEDKKIIQYFEELAPFAKADELYEKYGFSHKDAIAWLERQGEQRSKLVDFDLNANDSDLQDETYFIPDGYHAEIYGDKVVIKKGEQKPAMVEPKFKVGDWVVYECGEEAATLQIIRIVGETYVFSDDSTLGVVDEDTLRLWTIYDANDGDVLVDNGSIVLFKSIGNKEFDNVIDYYAYTASASGGFVAQKGGNYWGETQKCTLSPATKEQREKFIATMHKAGYEWDAEKLELKKVGQKAACEADCTTTWKPSGEQMAYLAAAIEESNENTILKSLYQDLDKLRKE